MLQISYGNFGGLLTGDLEGDGEREVLEEVEGCEFLKVAHHGSRNSTRMEFLEKVSPEICIMQRRKTVSMGILTEKFWKE